MRGGGGAASIVSCRNGVLGLVLIVTIHYGVFSTRYQNIKEEEPEESTVSELYRFTDWLFIIYDGYSIMD